jgi:hypothetical protein
MQRLTDMIRPDQIPDEVVEAAAVQISNGRTVAQAIAAALNAWTGMAFLPRNATRKARDATAHHPPPYQRRRTVSDYKTESIVTITGAEYEALRARVAELEEALRFYAEGNWSDGYPGGVQIDDNTLDFGGVARAALKEGESDD